MNKQCPYLEEKCKDLQCDCAKFLAYQDVQDEELVQNVLKENNFDISKQPFELMMSMQKSFASRMHKTDSLSKKEIDMWVDKYLVCIEDEIREVREHLNIYGCESEKHNQQEELKKEVIDIIHFVMDLFLVGNATYETIQKYYLCKYDLKNPNNDDLISYAYSIQNDTVFSYLDLYGGAVMNDIDDFDILKASCKLSDACALVRQQISWKHWKNPNNEINFEKLYDAYAIVFHEFINLAILTMDVNEIKDIYITKNVENIRRQYHNY